MAAINDVLQRAGTYVAAATATSSAATDALYTGKCRVLGYINTTAATAGTLKLFDNTVSNGTPLITVSNTTNQSQAAWFAPQGIMFSTGLCAVSQNVTGQSAVVIYLKD